MLLVAALPSSFFTIRILPDETELAGGSVTVTGPAVTSTPMISVPAGTVYGELIFEIATRANARPTEGLLHATVFVPLLYINTCPFDAPAPLILSLVTAFVAR